MKNIIDFFKNRTVISLIGLIIVALLVWFISPAVKFGDQNTAFLATESSRLITIVIMSLLWALNYLRLKLKDNSNTNSLVNDLQQVDNSAGEMISDQKSEEMLQMGDRFSQALSTLKSLNANGKGAKAALYELPWYIIIGPPGSGKTTALVNSSLDFPLADKFGKGALQGVGGTRNCDWWFTNDAVLIDTAGRYTTQDSHKVIDSSAWEGFLGLLKKHRRRRPINGAIVAISLQDLLTQTEEERVKHAKTIRLRIDELMEKLEVRFPVYLMFTKCDLISGFTEFFEDLGKEEREQVMGISLPDAPVESQGPDFDKLSSEYKNIVKRLYERVIWRIQNERDIKRRSAIQGFPLQMESLQSTIDSFVQQTFVHNRYKLQPYLRGMYFTSGTQDGTPIDRLMSSVQANFGLNSAAANAPSLQGKSYFLGSMFKNVIFPEAELVGTNPFYEKLLKWSRRVTYSSMVAASVTLFAFWMGAFTDHETNMREVQSHLAIYEESSVPGKIHKNDITTVLPSLNALASASIVFDQESQPWVKSLGMYDNSVNEATDDAYLKHLDSAFYEGLIGYIEQHLKANSSDEALYSAFRTYVMFNKLDHMNKQLVADWFTEQWEIDFADNSEQKQQLQDHFTTFMATDFTSATLNKRLLSSTRQRLLRMPVEQRIYQRIKSQAAYAHKVNMLDEMGGAVTDAYIITPAIQQALQISALYTKASYDEIDFSADSELLVGIAKETWLLNDENQPAADLSKDDLKGISKKVKKLYLTDYSREWQKVYDAMNVKSVDNLMQASNVLTSFADPIYSPIVAILNVTADNTSLTTPLIGDVPENKLVKGKAAKLANMAAAKANARTKLTNVDKKYSDINALMRESDKQPAQINNALVKIAQVQELLNSISVAPDPNLQAFEIVKARYQSGAANAITALNSYAKKSPKPIKRWLTTLSDESWRIILNAAHGHINTEWQNLVYQPYRNSIAGRYPVVNNAENDIALFDFVEFFKPTGNVDSFYEAYIKPFINTRGTWKNKTVDRYSLGFSSATLQQVKRALEVKDIFFRHGAESPTLAFSLKPSSMPKNNVRFMLEMGGERLSYSHGPKFWKKLNWSADSEQNRVRIVFEDLDEQEHSASFEGPWAWFRLISQSKLTKTSESSTYLVTYAVNNGQDNKHKISYKLKAKSVKNPFEKQLLSKFRCPEVI